MLLEKCVIVRHARVSTTLQLPLEIYLVRTVLSLGSWNHLAFPCTAIAFLSKTTRFHFSITRRLPLILLRLLASCLISRARAICVPHIENIFLSNYVIITC